MRTVVPGSPAEKASLAAKDILTEVDGTKLNPESPLTAVISKHKVGDTIDIKYWRDGSEGKTKATLSESPAESK